MNKEEIIKRVVNTLASEPPAAIQKDVAIDLYNYIALEVTKELSVQINKYNTGIVKIYLEPPFREFIEYKK